MVVANNEINNDKKCRQIAGNFDCHADAAVQGGAHRPMKRIHGFMQSHLMPPSGKCLRCIAPAAAMVDDFGCKQKKTNKTQLLSSKPTVDLSKKAKQCRDPTRTLYSRH
jgi:hypothetical protein